jgi:hypothetical protein
LPTPCYLDAFWRLCEQKIATSEPAPINHSAQVLAQRTGTYLDMRIIRMRSQPGDPTSEHRRVNWHHRWVVQMLNRTLRRVVVSLVWQAIADGTCSPRNFVPAAFRADRA